MKENEATFDFGLIALDESVSETIEPTGSIEIENIESDEAPDLVTKEPVSLEGIGEGEGDGIINEPVINNDVTTQPVYSDILKRLKIESYLEVDGDDEREVSVEAVNDIETAISLIEDKYKSEINELKERSILIDNIDNDRKEVMEFIAKGGDPKRLITYQSELQDVKQYDLENEDDAEEVIRKYYSFKGESTTEEVDAFIVGAKAKGTLTKMAEQASDKIVSYFEKQKEMEKENFDKLLKDRSDALKLYTKTFKEQLKERGFTEKKYDKVVDFATKSVKKKADNGGEYDEYELDNVIRTHRADPKLAVELAMFLMDKEAYLKDLLSEKEVELKKELHTKTRIARVLKSSGSDMNRTRFEENGKAFEGLVPLD